MRAALKPLTAFMLLVGIGAGASFYWKSNAPKSQSSLPASPPVPVVTAPVTQHDVEITLTGLGTVQPLNKVVIRSQVTGILESVDFTEGQTIEKGSVLAQIDPRLYQAKLDQALAQLARDQAQLSNVETNLGRNEPLLQHGFATDQQVTDQKAQVIQLQNTVKSDQAVVDDARTQLDYATLKAPFSGVTGIRLIDIGNLIHSTDTTGIVTLTQVQPISVVFTLPTADIPQVQTALSQGPVQVDVFDQSGKRKLDTGSLLLINNQADPDSGTVQLKATFPNRERQLWPGTFVNAEVVTSVAKNALTIPTDAIQQNDQGQYVFVVEANDEVQPRTIEIAQRTRGIALISKGLSAGDTVVTAGQYRLTAGTLVKNAAPADVVNKSTSSAGMLP